MNKANKFKQWMNEFYFLHNRPPSLSDQLNWNINNIDLPEINDAQFNDAIEKIKKSFKESSDKLVFEIKDIKKTEA